MRWLLIKDLQILRRSPLITALLIIYPIAIAVLIGFALSRGPEEPRVAFFSQVPEGEEFPFGDETEFGQVDAMAELCSRIECVEVGSVEEARRQVEDGDVLAALIIPPDLIDKLRSLTTLNPEQPSVQVLVNEEDPLKAQLVDDRIDSLVTEANLLISQRVSDQAAGYLDLLVGGGSFDVLGQTIDILGLEQAGRILNAVQRGLPPPQRTAVERVARFAALARRNLDLAVPLLGAVRQPIEIDQEAVSGQRPTLDAFAIGVAATVTLMFVTVLLVAGSLALEREENAFARLTRGLVGRTSLLAEKVALGVICSLVVTLVMLVGIQLFVDLDWGRFPLWIPAIVVAGAGFAAFGAAIGGAAREVRASSLLAFMVSLPIAFLSLVPSGSVSPTLFDVLEVVTAIFPFSPALDAISGALEEAGPSIWLPLLHLAAITLAYGALARLALRRFGS
ncbi:MAG TPA: ABC transporter permease [Solirubrobacterales bacterium]|nr:ABC transporter permease [Solirubrobacterales bacterium]